MSATSSTEVEQLQQLILHNPVTLNLLAAGGAAAAAGAAGNGDAAGVAAAGGAAALGDGGAGSAAEISHYSYSCSKDDRRLVVLSLLKLGLLRKKVRAAASTSNSPMVEQTIDGFVGVQAGIAGLGLSWSCSATTAASCLLQGAQGSR